MLLHTMGSVQTKGKKFQNNDKFVVERLKQKVRILQDEVNDIMCMRENESQLYEQEMMVFAFKEAEWKKEKKKLREEVKKLREKLDGKEDNNCGEKLGDKIESHEEVDGANSYLLHQIREEQARRDEAIEKWKQLYFAIKDELDHLILTTNQGERMCWKTEEEDGEEEMRAKEEIIKLLEAKIALLEQQELKREREVDILKQSLKIMFHNKKSHV